MAILKVTRLPHTCTHPPQPTLAAVRARRRNFCKRSFCSSSSNHFRTRALKTFRSLGRFSQEIYFRGQSSSPSTSSLSSTRSTLPTSASLDDPDGLFSPNPDWVPISTRTAMERFALTRADLAALDSRETQNPYDSTTETTFYLLPEVQEVARAKHGSLDNVRALAEKNRLREPRSRRVIFGHDEDSRAKYRRENSPTSSYSTHPFWGRVPRRIRWLLGRTSQHHDSSLFTHRPLFHQSDPASKAIKTAFVANVIQFVVKLGVSVGTGSSSMFSEAMHSLSDTFNQYLTGYGAFSSRRDADAQHPYGYGRDRNIFALFQSMSVLCIGGLFSLYHGLNEAYDIIIKHEHQVVNYPGVALGVVGLVFFVEAYSFSVATRQVMLQSKRQGMSLASYVRMGPDPINVAIMMEDGSGMLCSLFAGAALSGYIYTGHPICDVAGSLAIGTTLCGVGLFGIKRNREALNERSLPADRISRIVSMIQQSEVVAADGVHDVKCTMLGANSVRFKAEIVFNAEAIARRRFAKMDLAPYEVLPTLKIPAEAEDFLMREHANQFAAFSKERQMIELEIQQQLNDFDKIHIDLEPI